MCYDNSLKIHVLCIRKILRVKFACKKLGTKDNKLKIKMIDTYYTTCCSEYFEYLISAHYNMCTC